jgi:hypothetical protein
MICPYCENEMYLGCIEADGRQSIIWVEENKKRNILSKFMEKDCIVLDEARLFVNCEVSAYHCERCEKIIIDRKNL